MLTDNQRKKIKPVSVFLFLILCQSLGFPQVSDVQKTLRIKLWAPMDENPGAEISSSDTSYGTSIRSLKKTAPFLLTGMIYGWKFEYTPSDKTRNVAEYFSLEPVAEISENDPNITFTDSAFLESRVYCWLEYSRTNEMMIYRQRWNSIKYPRVSGFGESGKIDSVEAIKEAITEAAKNAIRSYAQTLTKNKPKEVSGTILLKDFDPNIKIIKGNFTAYLDFFLYVDKIIQYSQY